jgi:hypothetical protein
MFGTRAAPAFQKKPAAMMQRVSLGEMYFSPLAAASIWTLDEMRQDQFLV